MSTTEAVLDSFKKNPLCLLFFIAGIVLLLLGLTTYLNLPLLKELVPDPAQHWVAVALGLVAWLIAGVLYYRPPKAGEIPPFEELRWTVYSRTTTLDYTQCALLRFIDRHAGQGERIHQGTIEEAFPFQPSELYFRLEHLRSLKLITREDAGKIAKVTRYSYRLTEEYLNARRKEPDLFNRFFDEQERRYGSMTTMTKAR